MTKKLKRPNADSQVAILKAAKRPQGIAVTVRAILDTRRGGEEFSVVTVNFPKVVPSELWHSFKKRKQFLDATHALFRHLVYQLDVPKASKRRGRRVTP